MSQRISILRIFGAIAAVTLITGTVTSLIEYRRMDRTFWECVNARPMSAAVDLSQPGTFTAPFRQTCQITHGEAFYLTVDQTTAAGNQDLLEGLDGTILIKDSSGKEIQSLDIGSTMETRTSAEAPLLLLRFQPFPVGDYTATIKVNHGASALAGVTQSIHAECWFCGCERMPATIFAIIAFAIGIPGVVIGLHVSYGFFKHGWKTPPKRRPSRWLPG